MTYPRSRRGKRPGRSRVRRLLTELEAVNRVQVALVVHDAGLA